AALSAGISFEGQATPLLGLLVCAAIATVAHTLLARTLGLHQGRHLVGSFDELLSLASGVAAVAVLETVVNTLAHELMHPLTAPVIAAPTMLLLAGMSRSLVRLLAIRRMRRIRSGSVNGTGAAGRALIVGAGEVGRRLADSMLRDLSSRWDPVAFLDDDPRK